MSGLILPTGDENSLKQFRFPDLHTTVQLFGMYYRIVDATWSYPAHKHYQMFEIVYVISGCQHIIINGQNLLQMPGDLVLVHPGDIHSSRVENTPTMEKLGLHFYVGDEAFLKLLSFSKQLLYSSNSNLNQRLRPSLDKLVSIFRQNTTPCIATRMQIQSAVFDIFSGFAEALSDFEHNVCSTGLSVDKLAHRIAEGLEQLIGKLCDPEKPAFDRESINAIAKEIGISSSHCHRVFQKVYGLSPRKYLSLITLRRANFLLAQTDLAIEEIAHRLGYHDIASFSRQYKKWTGEAPSRYRQEAYKNKAIEGKPLQYEKEA